MTGKTTLGMVVVAALSVLGGALAQDHTATPATGVPALPLSPKTRAALVAEMVGVKEGMAGLSVSLATGEWDAAARQADRIRDSYIMKQKLTRAEIEELEGALPADFASMDEAFHRHADGLGQAARARNYELATFYYSKMMEGCGQCHARYAAHVLKGFGPPARAQPGH